MSRFRVSGSGDMQREVGVHYLLRHGLPVLHDSAEVAGGPQNWV